MEKQSMQTIYLILRIILLIEWSLIRCYTLLYNEIS